MNASTVRRLYQKAYWTDPLQAARIYQDYIDGQRGPRATANLLRPLVQIGAPAKEPVAT